MAQIKSFGCSFVYGSDLADDARGRIGAPPSQVTWPALIAQQKNWDYNCYAHPGRGNSFILDQVLQQSCQDESVVFVIGWSWIDRYDYIDGCELWQTLRPSQNTAESHFYFKNLHSQYLDKLKTLTYVKTAIDVLVQRNIPFVMTYMDELLLEKEWHTTSATEYLQHYVEPYLTTFDGDTFLIWSQNQGYKISDALHPLEAAHAAAARYMNRLEPFVDKI
jgi:hypothetical protein